MRSKTFALAACSAAALLAGSCRRVESNAETLTKAQFVTEEVFLSIRHGDSLAERSKSGRS